MDSPLARDLWLEAILSFGGFGALGSKGAEAVVLCLPDLEGERREWCPSTMSMCRDVQSEYRGCESFLQELQTEGCSLRLQSQISQRRGGARFHNEGGPAVTPLSPVTIKAKDPWILDVSSQSFAQGGA